MPDTKSAIGFRIELIKEPAEDGYHAYCPALKGLHTSGDTKEEALKNARYAAIAYIESLIKHNDPIPVGIIVKEKAVDKVSLTKKRVNYYTEDVKVACVI